MSSTRSIRCEDTGHNDPSRPPREARPWTKPPDTDALPSVGEQLSIRLDGLRHGLRRWIWIALGSCSVGALIFYLLIIDFIIRLQELPLFLQVPAWILAAVSVAFVMWAMVRLLRFWFSLQSFRQIEVTSPYRPSEDPGQDLVRWEHARKTLSAYLTVIATRSETLNHWVKIWPQSIALRPAEVMISINRLLETRPIDALSWARELDTRVLQPVDEVARARIRHYARRVGIKTAISPFPLVDSLAVLYNAALLLQDLAALYGRRLNRVETGLLLILILFQVYIAGEAQEFAESGLDEVQTLISDGMSGLTNRLTAFLSPKVAEGVLNAYILYRLGNYARRQFRPLKS